MNKARTAWCPRGHLAATMCRFLWHKPAFSPCSPSPLSLYMHRLLEEAQTASSPDLPPRWPVRTLSQVWQKRAPFSYTIHVHQEAALKFHRLSSAIFQIREWSVNFSLTLSVFHGLQYRGAEMRLLSQAFVWPSSPVRTWMQQWRAPSCSHLSLIALPENI